MGSGGGIDPGADLKKLQQDPIGTISNALVNVATLGTVGFENGQITPGLTTRNYIDYVKGTVRGADEAIGEVTGRNLARKKFMMDQDALAEAKRKAEQDRLFAIQKQEAQERQLSNKAASQSRQTQGASTGTAGVEQSMATQFLGL